MNGDKNDWFSICRAAEIEETESWTLDEVARYLTKKALGRRSRQVIYKWLDNKVKTAALVVNGGEVKADEINTLLDADPGWKRSATLRLPSKWQQQMATAGWWDSTMDANAWSLAESISPLHAAMLLSRLNPNTEQVDAADTSSSDEMGPEDFRRLKNVFDGAVQTPRTLKVWTAYARQRGLKIHSWITAWEAWQAHIESSAAALPIATFGTARTPVGAATDAIKEGSTQQKWLLKNPLKFPGYRKALYDFLKAAFLAGQVCPKAQDVVDAWKESPPIGIKVIAHGIEYRLDTNQPKRTNLKAIQSAIKNLMVVPAK